MSRALLVALALLLAAGPAAASDQDDVMAAVKQFVRAINTGDRNELAAICADQTSIIDEFPPHEWHGPGACVQWMTDYETDAKKNGISDGVVTIGKPKHLDVTRDRAYVVIPSTYRYKHAGKTVKESGVLFTLALRKSEGAWHAVGWAWPKP